VLACVWFVRNLQRTNRHTHTHTCIIVPALHWSGTCLLAADRRSRDKNYRHKTDTYCQSLTANIWRSSRSSNTKTACLICHREVDFGMQSSHRTTVDRSVHSSSKRACSRRSGLPVAGHLSRYRESVHNCSLYFGMQSALCYQPYGALTGISEMKSLHVAKVIWVKI
jgi:hypothetical protein